MTERHTLEDGSILFGDWRSIRDAIDSAYDELERPHVSDIPTDEWNLVGVAIEAFREASRPTCSGCKRKMHHHETIRCLDCKLPLCERCASKHFWPDGRQPGDNPTACGADSLSTPSLHPPSLNKTIYKREP